MPKSGSPSRPTPEDAAEEFFVNRQIMGVLAPKPAVERWIPNQRERFEAEMRRLEAERVRQVSDAVRAAAQRS